MKKVYSLVLCVFAAVLITGCGCDKKNEEKGNNENNKNTNTSIKNTVVEGLDIVDFAVLFEDNISEVYFTIENNGEKDKTFEKIECMMYDKDKNVMDSFIQNVGTIEPGKSLDVTYKVDKDLTKVASVEYSLE